MFADASKKINDWDTAINALYTSSIDKDGKFKSDPSVQGEVNKLIGLNDKVKAAAGKYDKDLLV